MEKLTTENIIHFGVFTDVHYCDCEPDTELNRYYRKASEKLEACISHFNRNRQLDFIVGMGDFIDRNLESFDIVNGILRKSNKKTYLIAGNHDLEVSKQNLHKVYDNLGLKKQSYFSLEKSGWQFLFPDGNEITFNSNNQEVVHEAEKLTQRLIAESKPNFGSFNGGIGENQLNWLDDKLSYAGKNHLNTIVICHFPLLPLNRYSLWNSEDVLSVLKKYPGLKVWLNGHAHEGNYDFQNNIHFLTLRAMADTENETAFAEISLSNQTIEINGFGRELRRKLELK